MKPIKPSERYIVKKLPLILISIKKLGQKEYNNINVRFTKDSVELSDYEDFRVLMYVQYSSIESMEWKENE